MTRAKRLAIAVLMLLSLLLAACGQQSATPAGGTGKLERTDITLGLSLTTVAFLPIYIADQKGFFKEEGLNVTLQTFQGGPENLQALVGGATHVNGGASTETIQAVDAKRNVRTFWELTSYPSNHWWAQKNIKTWNDLKGKKIAISRIGAQSDVLLRWVLRKQGLNPDKDVQVVAAGGLSERLAALRAGGLDATELTQPTSAMAQADGFSLLGKLMDYVPRWPNEVLYAQEEFLKQNPETVKALVRAINKASRFAKENEAEAIAVAVQAAKLKEDDARKGYTAYRDYYPPTGELSKDGWEFVQQLMIDGGEIKQKVPMDNLVDLTFINYAKTLK